MPKYDVWFSVRGHTTLKQTVTAKDKAGAQAVIKREWYGENPEIKQIKGAKKL
jgi:hypothetical protein